jgi:hypothetical protein
MIAREADDIPSLPAGATTERLPLPGDSGLDLLVMPADDTGERAGTAADLVAVAHAWAAAAQLSIDPPDPPPVHVPLYGCHVVWSPRRAAVIGPPTRLADLRAALVEFATREADLRDAERRVGTLLDGIDADAAVAFAIDERPIARRDELTARYREAVSIRRRLALLAGAIHAPPVHPPTLTAQLAERLRDRTRLAERHEHALDKADLAERVTEACGSRAADLAIARRQMALEWAIVVLLVAQTAILVVELLARGGAS